MAVILSWNDKNLEIKSGQIYTFSNWSATSSFETEADVNGKNMKKSKGVSPAPGSVSFDVILRADLGLDVRAEYLWWREKCEAGEESLLLLGDEQFGKYKWRLTGVSQSDLRTRGKLTVEDGSSYTNDWISCKMQLTFEESWYKVKYTKLEKKEQKLAKKYDKLKKKAENAKNAKAKDRAAKKAAKARYELEQTQIAVAEQKAKTKREKRAARKEAAEMIKRYYDEISGN